MVELAAAPGIAYFAPLATLIAACLGAFVLYLTSMRAANHSAQLEVAKFRLDWIQRLRAALSEFQSLVMVPGHDPTRGQRFYELGTTIELLLNPEEEDHKALMDHLYVMLEAAPGDTSAKYSTNPRFVELSQAILKREWDRAKTDLLGR